MIPFIKIEKILKNPTMAKKIANYIVNSVHQNCSKFSTIKIYKDVESNEFLIIGRYSDGGYAKIKPSNMFDFGMPIPLEKIIASFSNSETVIVSGYLILSKCYGKDEKDFHCMAFKNDIKVFDGYAKQTVYSFLLDNADKISDQQDNAKKFV